MSDIPPHRITRTHLLKHFGRAENAKPPTPSLALQKAHIVRQSYARKLPPKQTRSAHVEPLQRIAASKCIVGNAILSATMPAAQISATLLSVDEPLNEPVPIESDIRATPPALLMPFPIPLHESILDASNSLSQSQPPSASESNPIHSPSECLQISSIDSVSTRCTDTLHDRVISRLMQVNGLSVHSLESLARIRVRGP
jgi:hypothetical protein